MDSKLKVYYIIVFVILICFTSFIFFRLNKDTNENPINDVVYSSELKSGDLLFVSYQNLLGKFMKVWSNSKWTHVGIVYRDSEDRIFVMETSNYDSPYTGVILIPISEWYKYNRNQLIGVKQINKINSKTLMNSFRNLHSKKLDTFGISWMRLATKSPFENLKERENITCFELVVYLLQETDVIKKELSPSSYFPIDLIKENIPLNKEYSFEKFKRFKI